MKKNVAGQSVSAQLVNATTGAAFVGAVTVVVTIDAGPQGGGGAATHEGNGLHSYAPSQAETNGNNICFTFTGTGAIPVTVQVYTRPATDTWDMPVPGAFAAYTCLTPPRSTTTTSAVL